MSPRFSFRNLTPQLFGLIILPLTILLFVIAFGGMTLHQQAMRTLVGERDERAVRAAARTLGEQLSHRATAVLTLSLQVREDYSSTDLAAILESNEFPPPDFDHGVAFLTRGGEILAALGDPGLWENFDPTSNTELKDKLTRDTLPTFIQFNHPVTGEPLMFVTSPSFKGGPIAVGAFSPGELAHRALAGVFTPGEKSMAFMIDQDHQVLYQLGTFSSGESPASHAGVAEALQGESGANYIEVESGEHVVAYSPIPQVGWALVLEEPWEAVTSPLLRTTENAPLVLVPALLLALIALWFGLRQVVQPLQKLGTKAAEVGWGKFEAIEEPVGGVAEIQRLQAELIHLTHKVKAAQQGLRGYIGAITTGQEEERKRLARELHDDTLQSLIALNQRVQLASLALDGHPAAGKLAEIRDLTTQTIANLRRITRDLRPIYLEELGLVASLETLSRETQQISHLNMRFLCSGNQRRLPASLEMALYRIAQEAVNNILRHAHATQAELELVFDQESVSLKVTDNGRGFQVPESPTELTPQGHFGLLGLHERADIIGGALSIISSPEKGTSIQLTLPTKTKNHG